MGDSNEDVGRKCNALIEFSRFPLKPTPCAEPLSNLIRSTNVICLLLKCLKLLVLMNALLSSPKFIHEEKHMMCIGS